MADIIIKIIEPADTFDLLSLEEFKTMVGIPPTNTTQDEEIAMLITRFSDVVSRTCNRVFARETLSETWRCLQSRRVFLSHWPAKIDDIATVECPRGTIIPTSDWEFEERSGKLELFGARDEPIVVTYTGGYDLPDEAPPALKQATELMIREQQTLNARLGAGGMRMLSHKDARVMFFDPLSINKGAQGGGMSAALSSANALLMHYVRLEV
jgi:hypothetical protein